MKISKQAWLGTVAGAMALGLMGAAPAAQAKTYDVTFYVAAMGGHFAHAVCTIDPSSPDPIKVKSLDKIDIGDHDSHPVHDARIDATNRNLMFYSTYHLDKATGKTHVGKVDLKTGKVIKDIDVDTPANVKNTSHMYCASGQTKDFFMPITMSSPAYIDVFRKSDLKRMHTVFLEDTPADVKVPYKFYHGTTSPDMKKFFITINESDKPYGELVGKVHMEMLDAQALSQGKVKVLYKGVADGNKKTTCSFRQYFSHNGKLIANATGDLLFIIDANNLKVLAAQPMGKLEETHDAIFTPDDKYVVATSRTKVLNPGVKPTDDPGPDDYLMDGQLKLYDVQAKKFIGKPVSVCQTCHKKEGVDEHAILCGLDANWGKTTK
ncbi:MAG: hypothetical protein M0017_09010 [Desulfobacteraceae bacterium]|nr:hypothetical protein [Desulfobacteraceae bacterium]